ncbi:MAG TPA: hypothetical protein VGO55_18585 [Allosphingosinicella sp.]|jgi:hypothetical protein|nr:hypothetical protein [Allosphingosinicella sp.]
MAAREHKVSRRVLLGAACAAPVLSIVEGPLIRHPGLDPGSIFSSQLPQGRGIPGHARNDETGPEKRSDAQSPAVTKYDRAFARFLIAEAAVNAAAGEPDEDRYNALVGRLSNALRRLLRAPTPHLPALAAKLAAANRHLAWELTGAEACVAALARDAARLASFPSRSS